MSTNNKTVLITGASSGIGKSAAIELRQKGFNVYAAARRIEKMKDLEEKGIHILPLDVTDEKSMMHCVNTILEKEDSIDILVNNAGYGLYGSVEDTSMEEARRQVETNLFGLARMTQLVLPKMRENRYGKIVNIASMGGKIWAPFGAWYHGTKFFVEGFSDCLRVEVKRFGIDVIIIEPGAIQTDWGEIAMGNLMKVSGSGAYKDMAKNVSETMLKNYKGKHLTKPEVIGKCIAKSVIAKRPKTRYLLGYGAKFSVFAKNILGDKIYDKFVKIFMNI